MSSDKVLALAEFSNKSSDQVIGLLISEILQPLVYLLFAVAFLVFIWGVFIFIKNADNETERQKGKRVLLWGTVGLLIMFGAQGILEIIKGTFGLGYLNF